MKRAKKFAESQIEDRAGIREKLIMNKTIEHYTRQGRPEKIQELINYKNK